MRRGADTDLSRIRHRLHRRSATPRAPRISRRSRPYHRRPTSQGRGKAQLTQHSALSTQHLKMLIENLKIAFRSIASSKMRAILTVLGVMVGVAAVIAVVSIV